MKTLKLFLLTICCLTSAEVWAQISKTIEADLLQSFKRINYWAEKDRKGQEGAADSLGDVNDAFGKKLKAYTVKYSSTISEAFPSLKKAQLNMFTSADGLFKIYAWETWEGGTMRDFANVLQYKVGGKTNSVLLRSNDDLYVPFYTNLYTFKIGGKTYYLGVYGTIYSTKDAGTGVKVFAIENGKLNDDVKLIKTKSGLRSKIYYDYNFFSVVDIDFAKRPTITFDAATQTILIPLVDGEGNVTKKFITYKFTGKYFEKVSNLAK
nr:hypothetical protein [uncultured Mucilaginibacter sp.]